MSPPGAPATGRRPPAPVGFDKPAGAPQNRPGAARQRFLVRAPAPVRVEAATFFYPGWRALVDGTEVKVGVVPVRGTMAFDLAAGEHRVTLELCPTPLRRAASLASALAALALAAACLLGRTRSPRAAPKPVDRPGERG